jgi:hypothetical protein
MFNGPRPRGSFSGCGRARNPKKPLFDLRAYFCHSAPVETHALGFRLLANAPEGQKRFPVSLLDVNFYDAVLFFVSSGSDFISGQTLHLDGGITATQ